ncbi:MAG: SDR family oxidoreductase [Bradyrhizobium sp.]|uniref:SDR family NAD(P)-dependent oxidoreductase n=1 Tax=Bradyrhizobium sp. TaxID=376 RepID=UPI001DD0569D|nr:SDR family oxidoreductase [Bradyrhizobium sp.]MBV9563368.1 SDR family oxidoreductase [Bradyrhizobium sp.]
MTTNPRPLALVTGASSGIGAQLARELARDGHDLILCARRVERMQALADEFKAMGAACTIIAADLGKSGAAAGLVREIEAKVLVVDVLINAAGLGGQGRFHKSDPQRIGEMLQLNVVTLTELTRLVLPGMVRRGRGHVMLLSSTAAFQPGPNMAVYCASKAYVLSFGQAIAYEVRNTGVSVTTLCPGATATEFAEVASVANSALFKGSMIPVMSASEVARIGYRGLKARRSVVITGLLNRIMAISSRLSPTALTLRIASWMMSAAR